MALLELSVKKKKNEFRDEFQTNILVHLSCFA